MYSKIKTKMVDTQWKLFVSVKMQSKFQVENVFIFYFILKRKDPKSLKICEIWAVTADIKINFFSDSFAQIFQPKSIYQ